MKLNRFLFELDQAMHHHLDSPVKGDLLSLTRAWRGILHSFLEDNCRETVQAHHLAMMEKNGYGGPLCGCDLCESYRDGIIL